MRLNTFRQIPANHRHGARARWWRATIRSGSLTLLICAALSAPARATDFDEETRALLVEAVEAAHALDLYHARCRSDGSNRRTENLNKRLASRLRTTVLRVQDDAFPERDYRRVQERLQGEFLEMLRERGGCAGVKDSELPAQLRERYDAAMRAVEALP